MVTKTAREIIKNAMTLANADNSQFCDFELATNLLNTNYKYIYNEVVKNSLAFTSYFEANESTELPDDCYNVIAVYAKDGTPIVQSSQISHKDGGWWVQDGTIHLPKGYYKIVYATVPDTITAPPEWKEVSVTPPETNGQYKYANSNGTIQFTENTDTYMGKSVSTGPYYVEFYLDGQDCTEYLKRDGVDITNIQYHSPYIVVSYSDREVYVFTGLYHKAKWNYRCIEGHDTFGTCLALKTNDMTGFGMVFYDDTDGTYYEAPFVPDTLLTYPDNTFFAYMEYRLAYQIAGLLGIEIAGFLQDMAMEAEDQFYGNITQSTGAMLLTNMRKKGGVYVL